MMPEDLAKTLFKGFIAEDAEALSDVEKELMTTAERILAGDYSGLVGDPQLVELKKAMFAHLLSGLPDIDVVKTTYYRDLEVLKPVLLRLKKQILSEVMSPSTIVLHDIAVWSDPDYLKRSVGDAMALRWT